MVLYYEFTTLRKDREEHVYIPVDLKFTDDIYPAFASMEGLVDCFAASQDEENKLLMATFRELKKSDPRVIMTRDLYHHLGIARRIIRSCMNI